MAKAKNRPVNKFRVTIRKQLGCIKRDIDYLERFRGEGYALTVRFIGLYLTTLDIFQQQKFMFDHTVQ